MEPIVSIELSEYNRLKDLEYQFGFLTEYITICPESVNDPTINTSKKVNVGYINKNRLKYFYKNLLNIDKLIETNNDDV